MTSQVANLRRGLSLLEVILALAILAGAMAALGELVRMGTRSASAARDLTEAHLLCESLLAETTAGVVPPDPIDGQYFPPEYDPEEKWVYSVVSDLTGVEGLIAVRVTVSNSNLEVANPVSVSLVRWMADPNVLRDDTLPEPLETDEESSTTGENSDSTGGSGGGGAGGGGAGGGGPSGGFGNGNNQQP